MITSNMGNLSLNNSRSVPASDEEISHLPGIKLSENHGKIDPESDEVQLPSGVIGISDIEIDTEAMFMPGGHIFHKPCLTEWLSQKNICPTGRQGISSRNSERAQNNQDNANA